MTLNQRENDIIIASLKSETMGNLINRIPGSRLLIALLNRSARLTMSTSVLKACLVNLISKDTQLVFSIYIISVKPSTPVGPVEFSDIQKTSVVITWQPSEDDGGSPLTGYYIEMREAPKSSWQRVTTVNADVTSYCVQNVKEKKEYFFKIFAENNVGRSDALVSAGVTIKSQFGK